MLDNGAQTPEDMAAKLALSLSDITTLSGLPTGYLTNFAPVALREQRDLAHGSRASADVIRLPFRTRTS
jgi:hypothetical protein